MNCAKSLVVYIFTYCLDLKLEHKLQAQFELVPLLVLPGYRIFKNWIRDREADCIEGEYPPSVD